MQNNITHSIEQFIKTVSSNPDYCSKQALKILSITGHIPVAYNIARGAGFCSYFARMAETIGVKESIPLRISGKGTKIHKILGLASIHLFKDGYLPPSLINVSDSVEKAINELSLLDYQVDDEEFKKATMMLTNLVNLLPSFLQVINSNAATFKPIVEQQFIDYRIHIRGVPDLILENKEQKKAIVIEWKTSPETPAEWEEAQVLAYALLAAMRLGYKPDEAISKILGSYNESSNEFSGVNILPVIIRPTTTEKAIIRPHPTFSGLAGEDLMQEFFNFKKLLYNVKLEAEHLTILTFNTYKLSEKEHEFIRKKCLAKTKTGYEVNSLRYTPTQLPKGYPKEQLRYPCKVCREEIKRACKYYYGRGFSKKEEPDSTMWGLRFRVYEKLESLLLPYRAIQQAFIERGDLLFENLINGCGLVYEVQGGYTYMDREVRPSSIEVRDRNRRISNVKVDLLDEIKEFNVKNFTVRAIRKIRSYEENNLPSSLREDKTALLIFMDCNNPLLSPNLFCKIDEVNFDEKERIEYVLGLPSYVFRYQFLLLKSYKDLAMNNDSKIILVEIGANLLHLELKIIDLLQRELSYSESSESTADTLLINSHLAEVKREFENEYFSSDSGLIHSLREIFARGARR